LTPETPASPAPQPRNPGFEAACRRSFGNQRHVAALGGTLGRVEPGYAEVELPHRPDLTQHGGYFHAGVVTTIADTAGGYAALTLLPAGGDVLAVEFKVNLLNPAEGERLVARGRVLKSGRTLTVCMVEVDAIKDGRARTCAVMQQTIFNVQPR
jgi:uncharacterized protein (TIGR00369 family)